MPVYTRRLLDRANVSEGDALSLDEALDLGEHHTLAIAVNVLSAGAATAPTLTVVHAAANEQDAYTTLSEPVAVPLDAAGITVVYIPAFLRRAHCHGRMGYTAQAREAPPCAPP